MSKTTNPAAALPTLSDDVRKRVSFTVPYRCRDHELFGDRRAAVVAKLRENFSQDTLGAYVEQEEARTESMRLRAHTYNGGEDLFQAMRGVYFHIAKVEVVREALNPMHANWCADFLGL